MNQFTTELKNILEHSNLQEPSFVGRDCYSKVTDNVRAKICFCTTCYAENYDAVKVTLINKNEGIVDSSLIRFRDILGKKTVENSGGHKVVYPYIWDCEGKFGWYVYKPTKADFQAIANEVSEYIGMFGQEMKQKIDEPTFEISM